MSPKLLLKLFFYYMSLYYWDKASERSIGAMQLRKFRDIFEHARQHSTFYRELYQSHGVDNLKIETLDDVRRVPIVNKAMMRKYAIEDILTCENNESINIHCTSGSTGVPFKVAYSKFEDYTGHVRLTKSLAGFGYSPKKRMVLLSRYEPGHNFEVEEDIGIIKWLQETVSLFRRDVISIFEPIDAIINKLKSYEPYVLWSTPSMILLLANRLHQCEERLRIPLLLLMSETISEEMKSLFMDRVCENIFDAYGMIESPFIGFSYNTINSKNIIVNSSMIELTNIRCFNKDQVGDIVLTNLINKTMPFIRYDTGDYVRVSEKSIEPIKQIGKLFGRFDDTIYFGDKYTITYHQTYQLFRDFVECEQYKFIELDANKICLQLVVRQDANIEEVKKKAFEKWKQKYDEFPLIIEIKNDLPIDSKTGKFKVIEKKRAK